MWNFYKKFFGLNILVLLLFGNFYSYILCFCQVFYDIFFFIRYFKTLCSTYLWNIFLIFSLSLYCFSFFCIFGTIFTHNIQYFACFQPLFALFFISIWHYFYNYYVFGLLFDLFSLFVFESYCSVYFYSWLVFLY